jgi:SOS response regulatory protein OraA/RecX
LPRNDQRVLPANDVPPRTPKLTALRRAKPGFVLLELDGAPWRTVPDAVVVSCGLAAGVELDRSLLRRLRTALREAEALATAGRVVRRRDVSRRGLEERLARAGVAAGPRERAVGAFVDAGAVDDRRLAERRAEALAERGWGDDAIRLQLEQAGIGMKDVEDAVANLPPEADRAARLAAGAKDPRKAWALLARRGFDPDTAADAVALLDEGYPGGLG